MKQYYVIQVRSGIEKKIIDHFYLLNKISKEECELVFPQRKLKIRRQGQNVTDLQPLFPGYVFLITNKFNEELIQKFKKVDGFIRFLPSTLNAMALYGQDLEIVKNFTAFGETLGASKVYFNENDRIVVTEGPLLGFEGNIIKVDKRKKRVKIRLNFANNYFTIDLAFEEITNQKNV